MIKDKILVTDLETTGFSPSKDFIIEAAFVSLDLTTGETEILFDEFIKEDFLTEQKLSESWIIKNSDIKLSDVMNAKSLHDYRTTIQDILSEYVLGITAYNRDFDLRFLDKRHFRYWKALPDPMEIATYLCRIPGPKGLKWPKMPEAYRYLFPGEEFEETHRAGQDTLYEAKIVYELFRKGHFKIR